MVMPGDNINMNVQLIVPIAMEEKLRFAIREGGRTVGAGVVAMILKYALLRYSRRADKRAPRSIFVRITQDERSEYSHPPQGV
jgi:hypothetical protein